MGHLGVRKLIRDYNFYNDSNKKAKHKCDFCIPCILKVTNLDGKCVNYDVLKCKDCLSFIKQKENVEGTIFNSSAKARSLNLSISTKPHRIFSNKVSSPTP